MKIINGYFYSLFLKIKNLKLELLNQWEYIEEELVRLLNFYLNINLYLSERDMGGGVKPTFPSSNLIIFRLDEEKDLIRFWV